MINKHRLTLIVIAILLAISMFLGNSYIPEAQSARYFLKWSVDCAKGESVTIRPRYDQSFDWKDPYTGVAEKVVPLTVSCKSNTDSVSKTCNGYFLTRASRIDPMNKTHVTCYAVP